MQQSGMWARLLRFFDAAFGRYAVTSAAATGTDFALFSAFPRWASVPVRRRFSAVSRAASSPSRSAGAGRSRPAPPRSSQMLRFLFAWATSALLNSVGVPALLSFVGSPALAWAFVRAAVYLGWNYPLSRWFRVRGEKNAAAFSAQ